MPEDSMRSMTGTEGMSDSHERMESNSMDEDELRERVWAIYHDIEQLENMGFAPIGYPPMNPEETEDTLIGLKVVDEYNSSITLMRFTQYGIMTAVGGGDDVILSKDGEKLTIPRAYIHCKDGEIEPCIARWLKENGKVE